MKINKNKIYTIKLGEVDLKIVKRSLEYAFMNFDELLICKNCEKKLFGLVNRVTKLAEGKTLTEKIEESKNSVHQI